MGAPGDNGGLGIIGAKGPIGDPGPPGPPGTSGEFVSGIVTTYSCVRYTLAHT